MQEARIGVSFEELCDEDVLRGLIHMVLQVCEELGHADVVVLQELDDVHALAVLGLTLGHVGVLLEEFGDRDVVGRLVEHMLGVLMHVVLQELDDRHVDVAIFVDVCVAW